MRLLRKPKPLTELVQTYMEKRRKAGHVLVYVSVWVCEGREEAARNAMRKAAKEFEQQETELT